MCLIPITGDSGGEGVSQLLVDMNVIQVPKFLFYRGGKYLGRFFGSNRQDLTGQVRRSWIQGLTNAGASRTKLRLVCVKHSGRCARYLLSHPA